MRIYSLWKSCYLVVRTLSFTSGAIGPSFLRCICRKKWASIWVRQGSENIVNFWAKNPEKFIVRKFCGCSSFFATNASEKAGSYRSWCKNQCKIWCCKPRFNRIQMLVSNFERVWKNIVSVVSEFQSWLREVLRAVVVLLVSFGDHRQVWGAAYGSRCLGLGCLMNKYRIVNFYKYVIA